MSDKPIIFSAESIRAILAGDKTMTRRVVKLTDFKPSDAPGYDWSFRDRRGCWNDVTTERLMHQHLSGVSNKPLCPYEVGDRLWVRESWLPDPPQDDSWDYYGFTDGEIYNFDALPKRFKKPEHVIYKASWNGIDLRWRSPIYMPRWASRLTVEVTAVRVERLQDMTPEDAYCEGVRPIITAAEPDCLTPYREQWDALNAKRGYPWDANPWVFVISFKVAQP